MNDQLGSVAWLERTQGVITRAERVRLFTAIFGSVWEGAWLSLRAMASGQRKLPLSGFEPPATPMVNAAREHLLRVASSPMANHSQRTAFWTQLVLAQHGELSERDRETAWFAGRSTHATPGPASGRPRWRRSAGRSPGFRAAGSPSSGRCSACSSGTDRTGRSYLHFPSG